MVTVDDLTTIEELVIRSGNINLFRECVERDFYTFINQLKLHASFNLVFADTWCSVGVGRDQR